VDGDSSTNDTALLFANGAAGNKKPGAAELSEFASGLELVMVTLAKMIARDGEGATKLVEVVVSGALSQKDADIAAKAVANSPLVKTALFGNDPNWGRIVCAAGYSGARFKADEVNLRLCKTELVKHGQPVVFDAKKVSRAMDTKEIKIELELGKGKYGSRVWTCDLSYEYIKINAEYHT
jgi:glutamate N-acetyltransferase/amino-acid N-acetyltransferase